MVKSKSPIFDLSQPVHILSFEERVFDKDLDEQRIYKTEIHSNYFLIPKNIFETLDKISPIHAKLIYLKLFWLTYGQGAAMTQICVTISELSKILNLSINTIAKCLRKLIKLKLIKIIKKIQFGGRVFKIFLDKEKSDKLEGLKYYKVDSNIFKYLLGILTESDFLIYFAMYLSSWGEGKNVTPKLSYPNIAKKTGLVQVASPLRVLKKNRFLIPFGKVEAYRSRNYRVFLPHEFLSIPKREKAEIQYEFLLKEHLFLEFKK